MKKTIAMLSALAISASLVMPFSAFAADSVHVKQVTAADAANFTTIQAVADFFGVTDTLITPPTTITVDDKDDGRILIPVRCTSDTIIAARYRKNENIWEYSGDNLGYSLDYFKQSAESGDVYMISPDTQTITDIPSNSDVDVEYTVDPAYMVTIPASVTLSSSDVQTKTVTAENVKLDYGKEVVVKLTGASNTNAANKEGNKFHAMTEDKTSTATYTINDGATGIGSIVATFPTFTDETPEADKKKDIKFSAASGATFAGTHTEELTFTLSVEASEQGGSQGESASDWTTTTIGGVSLYVKAGATWAEIAAYSGNANKITIFEMDGYSEVQVNGSSLLVDDDNVKPTDIYSSTHHYSLGSY